MPQTTVTRLPKSEIKISFLVTVDEAKPYLEEAAKDISSSKPLPGFRPGKAGYDEVKRAFGEMTIWQAALERLVRAFYIKTLLTENIDTVGSPAITVDQLTPGQDIKFTIIAPVEPLIEEFPDLTKCKVALKKVSIDEKRVDDVIGEMRKMRRSESRVDRPATLEDLVIIDLEMKKNHVILEGGTGRDYRVYLAEDHYIPGFSKQLEGIKEGEERTFTLPFPAEHFQKHLAGQEVDFTAKAKSVFELTLPEVNDDFAKAIGLDTVEKLREKLKENLVAEAEHKAKEAAEIELLEKLVDATKFGEAPDLLVNEEVRRMIAELEHGVEEQGMKWDEYLSSLKKTKDELKLDFVPQAIRRIQTAVLVKHLAKKQEITATDEEVDAEVDRILDQLKPNDTETRERVTSPEYRDYIGIQLRNRKTIEWIKGQCISE